MGQALGHTAGELGCSERTLRRYIGDGLLRGRRLAHQGLELSSEETRYLKNHWALLHALLIAHRRPEQSSLAGLRVRLRRTLDKPVHLVSLEQAQDSPSLLADILDEGRPLLDRDGLWSELSAQASDVLAQAAYEDHATAVSALDTIAEARARLRRQAAMLGARTWTLAWRGPRSMAA